MMIFVGLMDLFFLVWRNWEVEDLYMLSSSLLAALSAQDSAGIFEVIEKCFGMF